MADFICSKLLKRHPETMRTRTTRLHLQVKFQSDFNTQTASETWNLSIAAENQRNPKWQKKEKRKKENQLENEFGKTQNLRWVAFYLKWGFCYFHFFPSFPSSCSWSRVIDLISGSWRDRDWGDGFCWRFSCRFVSAVR